MKLCLFSGLAWATSWSLAQGILRRLDHDGHDWLVFATIAAVLVALWKLLLEKLFDQNPAVPTVVGLLLVGIGIKSGFLYWAEIRTVKLELANLSLSNVRVAYAVPNGRGAKLTTIGWKSLAPGESLQIKKRFVDRQPDFFVYAESTDPTLIRWLYAEDVSGADTLYFQGNELQQCVEADNSFQIESVSEDGVPCGPDRKAPTLLHFTKVAVSKRDASTWLWVFDDPKAQVFAGITTGSERARLEEATRRLKLLLSSVRLQRSYDSTWGSREFPYTVGANVSDANPLEPGVMLDSVAPLTLFGKNMPIAEGDLLLSFNETPVFSGKDLAMLLYDHANDRTRGIEKPWKFKVLRDGRVLEGEVTYFFNIRYWGISDEDKAAALGYGVLNAITFGATATSKCAGANVGRALYNGLLNVFGSSKPRAVYTDFKECHWQAIQYEARLIQFQRSVYDGAAWLAILTPGAVRVAAGPLLETRLARALGSRAVARTTAIVTTEAVEMALWTAGNAAPGSSASEVLDEIRAALPFTIGIGIAAGTLQRI